MARLKKASTVYEKALKRAAALKSIDPNLDFGNGISLANFETAIQNSRKGLDEYNTLLSNADALLNNVQSLDLTLRDWYERVLAGVAALYGKNSSEYEQAGGVRKAERKKFHRKVKEA